MSEAIDSRIRIEPIAEAQNEDDPENSSRFFLLLFELKAKALEFLVQFFCLRCFFLPLRKFIVSSRILFELNERAYLFSPSTRLIIQGLNRTRLNKRILNLFDIPAVRVHGC